MPAAKPPEFRRRAVELLHRGEQSWTPCRWPPGTANPSPAPSCTPTAAPSTRRGSSVIRLREAELLGSMGCVASSVDNTMMESFWSTTQRELLDRRHWTTRADLASAIFEWIEGFHNPVRRHTSLDGQAPADFEQLHNRGCAAA